MSGTAESTASRCSNCDEVMKKNDELCVTIALTLSGQNVLGAFQKTDSLEIAKVHNRELYWGILPWVLVAAWICLVGYCKFGW